MSREPATRTKEIEPFHVVELLTRARELEREGRDVIHMEVGEPDFPTPPRVIEAARSWLEDGRVFYSPALGIPELRESISRFYASRYGVSVPASRIVVTAGASGALTLAFACLTEPGARWLLTDPGYPCNRHFIRIFEGVPVGIPVGAETNFQPSAELVARYWTTNTGGALFASPSNPTGTLIPPAVLGEIAEEIRRRNGTLVVDEIYHGLTYETAATTALGLGDDIFIVQSFSKYFQMTGWRLGWLVVPERYLRDVEKLAQNLFIAPSAPAQYAALAAFEPATIALLEERRAEFRRRRDALVPAIESVGFRLAARPEGAFYLYADCTALTDDSFGFATGLLEAEGVAITPGIDFGNNRPEQHVRFAYANDVDRMLEAVERIRRHVGSAR